MLPRHREGVADQLDVAGQQSHVLLLRLHEQQFVKWVLVFQRLNKAACGVGLSEWQEVPVHSLGKGQHYGWVEGAFPGAGHG